MMNSHKACIIFNVLLLFSPLHMIGAEELNSGLDLGALANIASSLGGNSQIMNMVSGLFGTATNNQKLQSPISNLLSTTLVGPANVEQSNSSDMEPNMSGQDQNLSSQQTTAGYNNGQPRRATVMTPQPSQIPPQNPQPANQNGLNNLMSLLPNILPSLGALLNNQNQPQNQISIQNKPTTSNTAQAVASAQTQAPAPTGTVAPIPNSARNVVNQVLTAFANGQIPNELIQLALSGRVPLQLVELALTGQVPSQMIQMIITGQVPMSTINAFLATMQATAPPGSNSSLMSPLQKIMPSQQLQGITKTLFEAFFNRPTSGNNTSNAAIRVPTLLGTVALPKMSKFGQMVGGTISNVASMIPF